MSRGMSPGILQAENKEVFIGGPACLGYGITVLPIPRGEIQ